jgi:hypothetical protein
MKKNLMSVLRRRGNIAAQAAMKIPPEILATLADVKGWAGEKAVGAEFTLLQYLMCVGTPDLLFAFAELFSPELVIHDGLHFLASRFSAETYDQWKAKGLSGEEIQRVINHVHVSSLFQEQEISDQMAAAAAQCIAGFWTRLYRDQGIVGVAVGETFAEAAVTLVESPAARA